MAGINNIPKDLFGSILQKTDDDACKALAKTAKRYRTLADEGLSAPGKELKDEWNGEAKQDPKAESYKRLQETFKFARRLPPDVGSLTKPRAKDPKRYEYIEGLRDLFEKLPVDMADVLVTYPHRIPELDLGERIGDTGYIDFVRADELKAPVMRGKDKLLRPFFVVGAHRGQRKLATVFFQRFAGDNEPWVVGGQDLTESRYPSSEWKRP